MPTPNLDLIKTIVVVMMENRSFDHMLGYLRRTKGWENVEGVKAEDSDWVQRTTNTYNGKAYPPFHQTDPFHKMPADPPHEYTDIARQMGYPDERGVFPMNGFVQSYANATAKPKINTPESAVVMGYFTGESIPVTDFLAKNFAICDHWFSSLPAGTQANRLMSMAGYSRIAHNAFPLPSHTLVYDWLDAHGVNWRVYHEGLPFFAMMLDQIPRILGPRFKPLADLWDDVRDESPSEFPKVIFIEPWYTDGPHHDVSRDDHAPSSVIGGQQFLDEVYRGIRANPNWDGTVMIINYDEHGGFFDHVSPPAVRTDPPKDTVDNHGFTNLGVRVPALIVSPFLTPGTICDKRLDHTSVLKFLGQKFGHGSGYSANVDGREVASVYEVLNLDQPRSGSPPAAPPLGDYLKQTPPPAGYLPNTFPPSVLGEAFKRGLDEIRKRPDNAKFRDLLEAFPPEPPIRPT
ncbi:MAG: alkaline phosphatase family protein [Chthoniobacterales bacterium]